METTLKKGMVFEAGGFTTIEVSKKHGTKFKVVVKDDSIHPFAVEGVVMSKTDIVKYKQVEKIKSTQKFTKVGDNEMKILTAVGKSNDAIVTAQIVVDGLSTFQIAGYISILERKGLVDMGQQKKNRNISISATGSELLSTLEKL